MRGTSGATCRSKASAARTVSPMTSTSECGIVPVGDRPGQAGAGRGRGAHAAAHDGGVVEGVGDVRVDVPGAEADDRLRRGRLDALARRVGPAGGLRQHAQDGRLVEAEVAVARPDAHDDLLGREGVAVGERFDDRVVALVREHVGQQHLGLVDAAEDALRPGEDLHDDDRVEPLTLE